MHLLWPQGGHTRLKSTRIRQICLLITGLLSTLSSSSRWKNPSSRMQNFLMEDPESFFACTLGNGLNDSQKMELLKKVFRLLPFIPNGNRALDIRPIHNLEKLTAYCSKQFEAVRPAYEVLDPVNSDMDITFLLNHKQDGTHWKTRYEAVSPRPHRSLSGAPGEPVLAGLKPI